MKYTQYNILSNNLVHNKSSPSNKSIMEANHAARNGNIKYVQDNLNLITSIGADWAILRNHYDIVELLQDKCTSNGADWAASSGNIELVLLLEDKCTTNGANAAAQNGHVGVVRILKDKCTSKGADYAAAFGYKEIVYILEDKCTKWGALFAKLNGHKDIEEYLSYKQSWCSKRFRRDELCARNILLFNEQISYDEDMGCCSIL
jgi:hypothetical protein